MQCHICGSNMHLQTVGVGGYPLQIKGKSIPGMSTYSCQNESLPLHVESVQYNLLASKWIVGLLFVWYHARNSAFVSLTGQWDIWL